MRLFTARVSSMVLVGTVSAGLGRSGFSEGPVGNDFSENLRFSISVPGPAFAGSPVIVEGRVRNVGKASVVLAHPPSDSAFVLETEGPFGAGAAEWRREMCFLGQPRYELYAGQELRLVYVVSDMEPEWGGFAGYPFLEAGHYELIGRLEAALVVEGRAEIVSLRSSRVRVAVSVSTPLERSAASVLKESRIDVSRFPARAVPSGRRTFPGLDVVEARTRGTFVGTILAAHLAHSYWQANRCEAALEFLRPADFAPGSAFRLRAMYERAYCEDLMARTSEAEAHYQALIREYGSGDRKYAQATMDANPLWSFEDRLLEAALQRLGTSGTR